MKIIHKPVFTPPLRKIRKTNEGAGHPIHHKPHPIKDSKFFRREPTKKRKRK